MSKLTIADAAELLGVSKEAIHNRIRRGTLESIVENDVKFVIINKDKNTNSVVKKPLTQKQMPQSNEKYYKFLEEQNVKLQDRVDTLEGETRTLRDQKEQMLIEERIKIENIYREKDEQLKSIINIISSKLMLSTTEEPQQSQEPHEAIEGEIEVEDIEEKPEGKVKKSRLISLNKYLKSQELSKKKITKIKEEFKQRAKNDSRVVTIGKKHYIDLQKYDYSDFSI